MDIKELMEKAAAHVVKMLDGTDGERWNGMNPMYEGICGWCGVMSPMNRPAFVAKFGEDFTKAAETEARRILAARADFWANSKARGYEEQANALVDVAPSALEVGYFVWGVMDGLKCDHEDLRRTIRDLIEEKAESKDGELKARLCKIIRIEEVEDIERDAATVLNGWRPQGHEGGSGSDDVSDEEIGKWGEKFSSLTAEQKRTFYTLAVLVRDKQGKYFLIDPEGYDYPRYVILPKNWERMYAETVGEVTAKIAAEKEAAAKAKAEKEAAARAAYDARCAKWEGIMEELPKELQGNQYNADYRKVGKRNVVKMAKTAFPWVKFSVSYDKGWGRGYVLKWKNGPTVAEVKEKTDFGLFKPWEDTFHGYDDSTDTVDAQFTDFSDRFGGVGNGVKFEREECEKDQNGDPNGKPPTPKKAEGGETVEGERATMTLNEEKHGVEIRFAAIPSEAVRSDMKRNGWRWTRFGGCWYNRDTEENREYARRLVAEFGRKAA